VAIFPRIISIFQSGVLLLDEVDLLLHPLKSELNWPLGVKKALDYTYPTKRGSGGGNSAPGLRWQIGFHILDAVFFVSTGKTTTDVSDSAAAQKTLADLRKAVVQGVREQLLQVTPHLVLLDVGFYHETLKPLFANWILGWFGDKGMADLSHDQLLDYIIRGAGAAQGTVAAVKQTCSDDAMKLLNLSHEWAHSVLPHVLSKVNRVSYGLLDDAMLHRAQKATLSRKLLCVPFVGKDVPSPASEFSHPEVVIGLTIAGYRHEGLRLADFRTLVQENKDMLRHEVGPVSERPSSIRWRLWVELAGGKVRGGRKTSRAAAGGFGKGGEQEAQAQLGLDTRRLPNILTPDAGVLDIFGARRAPHGGLPPLTSLGTGSESPSSPAAASAAAAGGLVGRRSSVGGLVHAGVIDDEILESIWPLHLVDSKDKEQEQVLYTLLRHSAAAIQWYLDQHTFPLTMRFQPLKLSASGQELGGDLLFRCRCAVEQKP